MVTVYVDVLILLNAVVDFLILVLASALAKEQPRVIRLILASFVGALFSLYIFLPSTPFWIEFSVRVVCSATSVLCCFGFGHIKRFLRLVAFFYAASFLYVGAMLGIWFLFYPSSMAINNGVVYVDFSPLLLLATAFGCYLILTLLRLFTHKSGAGGKQVDLTLIWNTREYTVSALVDTGHNLRDEWLGRPVIVADESVFRAFFSREELDCFRRGEMDTGSRWADRFRLIPCSTVAGKAMLPALRLDTARVSSKNLLSTVRSPLLALSETSLGGDYHAVAGTDLCEVMI